MRTMNFDVWDLFQSERENDGQENEKNYSGWDNARNLETSIQSPGIKAIPGTGCKADQKAGRRYHGDGTPGCR